MVYDCLKCSCQLNDGRAPDVSNCKFTVMCRINKCSGVRCTGTIDVPKHVTSPLCTPNMVVPRATHLVFRTTLAVSSTVTHGARNKTTCLPTANTKHSLSHVGGPRNEIIKEISHVLLCVPASSISCSTLLMWLSRVWISQAHAIIKHV